MPDNNLRIIFYGTPDIAVESLKRLIDNKLNVVAVVTAPDKPAGRGLKLHQSPVKKFALSQGIRVLQAQKLKSPDFLNELKNLNPDLQIVVAFRMLPQVVWKMPKYGTFNLHTSLLPQYRGAAPINWAIINGEKESGITTFFLKQKIDTGNILFRETETITASDTAGTLHDRLMLKGADLILKTVRAIIDDNYTEIEQHELVKNDEPLKEAPKIYKEDCKINWHKSLDKVFDHIRGLSPYPTAWSEFEHKKTAKVLSFKLFSVEKIQSEHQMQVGDIKTDGKKNFEIALDGGYIKINDLQLQSKKRMKTAAFLSGFRIDEYRIKL